MVGRVTAYLFWGCCDGREEGGSDDSGWACLSCLFGVGGGLLCFDRSFLYKLLISILSMFLSFGSGWLCFSFLGRKGIVCLGYTTCLVISYGQMR